MHLFIMYVVMTRVMRVNGWDSPNSYNLFQRFISDDVIATNTLAAKKTHRNTESCLNTT